MICHDVRAEFDDLLDGQLDWLRGQRLTAHVRRCASCHRLLEQERTLRRMLLAIPAPQLEAGTVQRVLENARTRRSSLAHRLTSPVFAGALAASLAAGVFLTVLSAPQQQEEVSTAPIVMRLAEPQELRLRFNAGRELRDVHMRLTLPKGVELQGRAGKRIVSFTTLLRTGTNYLSLPLIASRQGGGCLKARIEHASGTRSYCVPIRIGAKSPTSEEMGGSTEVEI